MLVKKEVLGAFEFFNFLYGYGDGSFVSQHWFQHSTEYEYSRLVLSLTAFLLGKKIQNGDKKDTFLRDLSQIKGTDGEGCSFIGSFVDGRLHSSFCKIEQLLRSYDSMRKMNVEDFKYFLNFQTLLKKDINCLICWVVENFFKVVLEHEDTSSLNTIESYINLAYNIDHTIWDFIVSDYIFAMREKGKVMINSFNCNFNAEVESLFFLMITPYSICPTLCSILLIVLAINPISTFIACLIIKQDFSETILFCYC